ncbi:MAG: LacI family DNA-binding transcriptional regulator [Spirochaetaceae bacterium]|jgi:LacI family transcriptional regulator|nr:LacI family DNA-binding transcriptional regulator [Spirochaetaceae bacterium]
MTPRIIDIAKAADVSPSAVSLALNNKSGVSSEIRQKIIHIAAALGYRNVSAEQYDINVTVKLLKIAKHGHVVNDHHNAFITEYMEGIETGARKRKYKLEVSFFNKVSVQEIVNTQKGAAVNGFIILGTELNAHELNFFTELPQPVVFIDTYFPLSIYDCVDMDNMDGVFKAIQHLYNYGHRNIGLIKSSYESRNFKMREFGFHEVMDYFSLPVQDRHIIGVDPAFVQSAIDMNRYLDEHSSLPTAFFCMNDSIAYGCMKALRDHNVRIPGDVSIIGFDDLPSSSVSEPSLTTIRVSTHQIGQRALEKLAERIGSAASPIPEKILISGKLVTRASVKKI